MKKIFFAVVMMAVALSASAQPQEKADYKTGKNSVEIGFNPFSNNFQTFRIDELKYRRFFGKHALRITAGIDVNSNKDGNTTTFDKDNDARTGSSEVYNRNNFTDFFIGAGYEYHFNVAPRVSLYAGGELGYAGSCGSIFGYENTKTIDYNGDDIVQYYDRQMEITTKTDGVYSGTFFVNALAGIDFHVYRGLYLGAEVKLGYRYTGYNNDYQDGTDFAHVYDNTGKLVGGYEYTYATDKGRQTQVGFDINEDGSTTVVNRVIQDVENTSSSQNFSLRAEGALRIGYRF